MAAGADGRLRDKTRPSHVAPLEPDVIERVVALTLTDAPVRWCRQDCFAIPA
jgi:hypothetical protein